MPQRDGHPRYVKWIFHVAEFHYGRRDPKKCTNTVLAEETAKHHAVWFTSKRKLNCGWCLGGHKEFVVKQILFAVWRLIVAGVVDVYKAILLSTSIAADDDDVGVVAVNLPRVVSVYHVLASLHENWFSWVISSLYILLFQILLIRIEVCVPKDITGEFQL